MVWILFWTFFVWFNDNIEIDYSGASVYAENFVKTFIVLFLEY